VAAADSSADERAQEAPSLLDLQFVVKLTEDCAPEQLRYLVHSFCPAIYGHELVKVRQPCSGVTGTCARRPLPLIHQPVLMPE
jgi:hypothetical protein